MKAFPLVETEETSSVNEGMDLRDYFAAKALMSMLSPIQQLTEETPMIASKLAYKFADAMMKAREK